MTIHREGTNILILLFIVLAMLNVPVWLFMPPLVLPIILSSISLVVYLFVFNFFGDFVGFTLGINWVNALITGCLGVPGVILLILIKLFF